MDAETYLDIERMSKLGRLGEQLAAECLARAKFVDIRNLNESTNFRFAQPETASAS
jgi:hypothetical protein